MSQRCPVFIMFTGAGPLHRAMCVLAVVLLLFLAQPAAKRRRKETLPPGAVRTGALYEAGHPRPHPELCPALGARTRLVILVSSAPAHAAERRAVRLTWGREAQRKDVVLGFVLGAPPTDLHRALDEEDALFSDLIEGQSVESYSNLTLKTISMLEWLVTYCPRAPRLLKTDDDMFINVPRLLAFVAANANATRTVWGRVARSRQPRRNPRSKYYIPREQFPGAVFPDYTKGAAYLLTADAARLLLRAAPRERYLQVEDVFVTGVLAARADIRRVHHDEFYDNEVTPHPDAVQCALSIHLARDHDHEQYDLWDEVLDGKTKCATLT